MINFTEQMNIDYIENAFKRYCIKSFKIGTILLKVEKINGVKNPPCLELDITVPKSIFRESYSNIDEPYKKILSCIPTSEFKVEDITNSVFNTRYLDTELLAPEQYYFNFETQPVAIKDDTDTCFNFVFVVAFDIYEKVLPLKIGQYSMHYFRKTKPGLQSFIIDISRQF